MDSPMFPGNTITIEGLSKCYEMYDKPSDRLKQFAVPTLYRCLGITPRAYFREFWALREVSFTVGKGETVGIIGRNGSGKSTLLQLISGTLNPTSGNIQSQGRIAALLELGTGFNPDFTGRENVYLNAALLGMTTHAIDECYPDIVEFAGIGDFIDQPVKTYSSGMFVRLAFAVQVQVCPDILIVDEALAVGDEAFQRKCYRRIHELKERGVSVLFVSHDAGTVVQLCDRVILLEGGRKIMEGPAKPVVSMYQKLLYAGVAAENNLVNDIQLAETQTVQASSEAQEHSLLDEDWDPNLAAVSTLDYVNHGASILEVRLTNS